MQKVHTFTVEDEDASKRLDIYISRKLPTVTRSVVKSLITQELVRVNSHAAKASYKIRPHDVVRVELPPAPRSTLIPDDIPLDILFEDSDVIVVNKPPGLVVHPGAGRSRGTLVNALLYLGKELSGVGNGLRPGIVHRLDKDTSGVMVVAKNDAAHNDLARQFSAHTTSRRYMAVVWGLVDEDEGTIDLPIGRDVTHRKKISTRTRRARKAITRFTVLARYNAFSLVELTPQTGRTHQIRVHLAASGHPIVGDPLYGKRTPPSFLPKYLMDVIKRLHRQCLHARTLGFTHPATGKAMNFDVAAPSDMEELVDALERWCAPDGGGQGRK